MKGECVCERRFTRAMINAASVQEETKHRAYCGLSGSALKVDHDNLNSPRGQLLPGDTFWQGRIGNRKRPLQQSLLFCTPNLANGGGVGDHETRRELSGSVMCDRSGAKRARSTMIAFHRFRTRRRGQCHIPCPSCQCRISLCSYVNGDDDEGQRVKGMAMVGKRRPYRDPSPLLCRDRRAHSTLFSYPGDLGDLKLSR